MEEFEEIPTEKTLYELSLNLEPRKKKKKKK